MTEDFARQIREGFAANLPKEIEILRGPILGFWHRSKGPELDMLFRCGSMMVAIAIEDRKYYAEGQFPLDKIPRAIERLRSAFGQALDAGSGT